MNMAMSNYKGVRHTLFTGAFWNQETLVFNCKPRCICSINECVQIETTFVKHHVYFENTTTFLW